MIARTIVLGAPSAQDMHRERLDVDVQLRADRSILVHETWVVVYRA